jgi:type I restriction enzyme S subunit
MPKINRESLKEVMIALPPEVEQKHICSFIDATINRIDTLTVEAQKAITLLQERRSALISASVTGQIDVREHQQSKAA